MGTYLSTPVTEKCEESGETNNLKTSVVVEECKRDHQHKDNDKSTKIYDDVVVPCSWGVVDMQGWRKSMEDAHIAVTDLPLPPSLSLPQKQKQQQPQPSLDAKVFAVFDGHGGPEVARFCQLYLVSVLQQQPTWLQQPSEHHDENNLDDHETTTSRDPPNTPVPSSAVSEVANPNKDDNNMESAAAAAAGETCIGQALRSTFHALDRMIDDPNRRSELIQLRNVKPQRGERREVTYNPPPLQNLDSRTMMMTGTTMGTTTQVAAFPTTATTVKSVGSHNDTAATVVSTAALSASDTDNDGSNSHQVTTLSGKSEDPPSSDQSKLMITNTPATSADLDASRKKKEEQEDDDSLEVVGKEGALQHDRDMMMEEDDHDHDADTEKDDNDDDHHGAPIFRRRPPSSPLPSQTKKVTTMFQKILLLGIGSNATTSGNTTPQQQSGQMIVNVGIPSGGGDNRDNVASFPPSSLSSNTSTGLNARKPTMIHQGRMICNLPDHPIHAGATAIVAVMTGRLLTVANAGDSRAVLCRADSFAFPLSYDHKPQQERELLRIQQAGGFVNAFGRVNGNLNLSRSIGDLKYKQVPGIPPQDQIITAEPDIIQITLRDDDEFILLGCDGIWDCLSNESAVEYVMQRIDQMPLTEIGKQMLDDILSDDPRVTQGIGGDNMTSMIVDLRPSQRSWRRQPPQQQPPQQPTKKN